MSTILKKKDMQTAAKLKGRNMTKSNRERKRRKFRPDTGYIYLGRIPHGFYEDQMTAYFSQFGKVLSAYVPRSKKTGRSKGYGFVEFKDEEVAKIAAETMNNYLMYNKVIKCSYIPPEERKNILKNRTGLISPKVINRRKTLANKKRQLSKLSLTAYQKQTERKMLDFKRFFEERGIEFNIKIKGNDAENYNLNDTAAQKEESKSVNDTENEMNEFGVLEIDTSDTDIHFQTPPQVKKVFKKSSNGSVVSRNNNLQTRKKPKIKRPTRLKSEEPKQAKKCQKLAKKRTKTLTGKNETKVKLPRAQKSEALKKRKAVVKRKKPKKKQEADDSLTLKKENNKKKNNATKLLCKKILSGTVSGK